MKSNNPLIIELGQFNSIQEATILNVLIELGIEYEIGISVWYPPKKCIYVDVEYGSPDFIALIELLKLEF